MRCTLWLWGLSVLVAVGCDGGSGDSDTDTDGAAGVSSSGASGPGSSSPSGSGADSDADSDPSAGPAVTSADPSAGSSTGETGDPTGDTEDEPDPMPTSGCGSPGRTGQWQQEIEVPGVGTRSFFVSVPSSYDADVPQSVYFAVHGTGWTGAMIQPYYGIEGGTNEIYIYPDRDPGHDNLQTTGDQAEADLLYFDALVDWVSNGYCVDENRLFALGHSGGGNWVTFLSCRRGDVLRAVVPTGTGGAWWYVGGVADCEGPIDAMVVHGRQDQIIPYDPWGLETLDYFRSLNGCGANTADTYPGTSCVRMDGCDATYDCSHDEPTFLGDGHQIPDWHLEAMTWLRSL